MNDAIRPSRWNLLRAAMCGAVAGFVVSGWAVWSEPLPYPLAYSAGRLIGGVVVGAVLAGLAAGLGNLLFRPR